MSQSTLSTTLAAATYVDVPVPPHQHLLYHDPAEWDAACCACQNQSLARLFFDEGCSACRAQRDQDRPYVVVEWAVRHPSGVVEDRVSEGMARRATKKHPAQTLLRRERIVTPDVVSDYVAIE